MNKTKNWLFEKRSKIEKPVDRFIKENLKKRKFKKRGSKLIKSEVKKETLQLMSQKYKGS